MKKTPFVNETGFAKVPSGHMRICVSTLSPALRGQDLGYLTDLRKESGGVGREGERRTGQGLLNRHTSDQRMQLNRFSKRTQEKLKLFILLGSHFD